MFFTFNLAYHVKKNIAMIGLATQHLVKSNNWTNIVFWVNVPKVVI
jgi:hypothetical protein